MSVLRDATKKKTGFFGNFSQVSDLPPPFWEPLFPKKKHGLPLWSGDICMGTYGWGPQAQGPNVDSSAVSLSTNSG